MSRWNFEIANYNQTDAHALVTAVRDAQGAANGHTFSADEDASFGALLSSIDGLMAALGTTNTSTVALTCQASYDESSGNFALTFSMTGIH